MERKFSVGRDGNTSLGNYSKAGSFGEAFKAAHKAGGSGHTFSYNGKLFNSNCADKGDYGKNSDKGRSW